MLAVGWDLGWDGQSKQPADSLLYGWGSSQDGGQFLRARILRESPKWKAHCLLCSSLRNHRALFPPHSLCQGNNDVLPRFKGRNSRLYLLVGSGNVLEDYVGLEIILRTFSENTTHHALLLFALFSFLPPTGIIEACKKIILLLHQWFWKLHILFWP